MSIACPFCLAGPDISSDQEDHTEDSPHLLPHGYCHRVGHGYRYGGKTELCQNYKITEIDFLLLLYSEIIIFFLLTLIANGRHWHYSPQLHTRIPSQ